MLAVSFDEETAEAIALGRLASLQRSWGPSPPHDAPGWLLVVVEDYDVAVGLVMVERFERPALVRPDDGGPETCPGPWTWHLGRCVRLPRAVAWDGPMTLGLAIAPAGKFTAPGEIV